MRTEITSGPWTPNSSAPDLKRPPDTRPAQLPGSPGELTARRSANVETPPPESAPRSRLASLPPELISDIVTRLSGEELKNLTSTSRQFRDEFSPLRALSVKLSKVLHRVVDANRRGANEWSSLGFRRRFNPHQALADLGEALGHGPQTEVVAATVNELSASEFAVLKDFVGKIPSLWTDKMIDLDPQLQAIGLARAFFSRFKNHINEDSLNEFALAVVELCKSAPAVKHDHKLSTEAFRAVKKVTRIARSFTLLEHVMVALSTVGSVPVGAAAVAIASVPVSTARNMFKEDKTSSMALKFLVDVIGKIPGGQISNELFTQVRDLLVGVVDETGQKAGRLAAVLKEGGTYEQRTDLYYALITAGRPALASKI